MTYVNVNVANRIVNIIINKGYRSYASISDYMEGWNACYICINKNNQITYKKLLVESECRCCERWADKLIEEYESLFDIENCKVLSNTQSKGLIIENVIYNDPATIVFWADGTKTVVKCDPEYDTYDPEKGLAMAISKKLYGNKLSYYNIFKHWLKKYKPENSPTKRTFFDEIDDCIKLQKIQKAYNNLKKAMLTCDNLDQADNLESAIGYLGEVLDD